MTQSYQSQYDLLAPGFLNQGYYDSKGALRKEILDDEARKLGQRFARGDQRVTSAQMRRFYGDVKELQTRLERNLGKKVLENSGDPELLAPTLAMIRLLKAKAAYARGRQTARVSLLFEQFMDRCVDQIKSPRDFHGFTLVFEAVVGYFYGAGGERNR
jgi:CRISPR-associated protein Csm2